MSSNQAVYQSEGLWWISLFHILSWFNAGSGSGEMNAATIGSQYRTNELQKAETPLHDLSPAIEGVWIAL